MSDIRRIHANGRLSKVTVHNGVLYMTGQVAEDDAGKDLTLQTQEVLHRIDTLLAEAGSDKTRILKAYLYVADISGFGEINAVWDAWVAQGHEPARTTIEARLTGPQYGIEIGVIAAV
jgi:enamine deaminase RidA (YjgF/YER057c/UK114 family)